MDDFLEFRTAVQKFIRVFNLGSGKTPCGNNISPQGAHTLMLIARNKLLTQKDLANSLAIDKSNVTRLCESLAKQGLIRKKQSKEDKRANYLTLTSKGLKISKKVESDSQIFLNKIFKSIPEENSKKITQTLDLLSDACLNIREM